MENWIDLTTIGGYTQSLPYNTIKTVISTAGSFNPADPGCDVYVDSITYYSVLESHDEVLLRMSNADVAWKAATLEIDQDGLITEATALVQQAGEGNTPDRLEQLLVLGTALVLRASNSKAKIPSTTN